MMGELFASQVHHALCKDLFPGLAPNSVIYCGDERVGKYFREKIIAKGRKLTWNELTRSATGRFLEADSFAADFDEAKAVSK
jgi:peptidyl-dipeptidase A